MIIKNEDGASMAKSVSYDDLLIESLKNKNEAVAYLNAALEECKDGSCESQQLLLIAFRNVAMAQGGFSRLAMKTGLGRESLYRTLSKRGNPKLTTLTNLVGAFGFELKISLPAK